MIGGVIVSHGTFGACLLQTVEMIAGKTESLAFVSNEGLSTRELADTLRSIVSEMNAETVIFFVDIFGGSCWQAAKMVKSANDHIVTGVNIPMVLSFLHKRSSVSIDGLQEVLDADGKRGIRNE